jgi:hypothetical protein
MVMETGGRGLRVLRLRYLARYVARIPSRLAAKHQDGHGLFCISQLGLISFKTAWLLLTCLCVSLFFSTGGFK